MELKYGSLSCLSSLLVVCALVAGCGEGGSSEAIVADESLASPPAPETSESPDSLEQRHGSAQDADVVESEGKPLDKIVELWNSGDQEVAIERFLTLAIEGSKADLQVVMVPIANFRSLAPEEQADARTRDVAKSDALTALAGRLFELGNGYAAEGDRDGASRIRRVLERAGEANFDESLPPMTQFVGATMLRRAEEMVHDVN